MVPLAQLYLLVVPLAQLSPSGPSRSAISTGGPSRSAGCPSRSAVDTDAHSHLLLVVPLSQLYLLVVCYQIDKGPHAQGIRVFFYNYDLSTERS